MRQDYQPFVDRMIHRYEGGYGWNRKDPGGPTKYGVTCYDLAEHRGKPMTSMADWAEEVRNMPLSEAEDIYRTKYAAAIDFDALPTGVDCTMMDYAVNSGIARPIRVAAALLKLPSTGRLGPTLLSAIQRADPTWFVNAMCQERLHFMHQIRGGTAWQEFGPGWGRRVNDLGAYSVALIQKGPAPDAPDLSTVVTPKAIHPPAPSGGTVTATVTTAGSAGAAAHTLGIQPWEIMAGVLVIIGIGFVVHNMRQNKVDALNAKVVLPPNVIPKAV